MPRTYIFLLLAPFLAVVPSAARITVDDEVHRVRVDEARLSPGGDRIVFVRSDVDWDENRRVRTLVMARAGGEPVPFTAGPDDHRPRWSPDGSKIAFLRKRKASDGKDKPKNQLWVMSSRGGEARRLTDLSEGVKRFEWAPGGDRLFFLAEDPRDDEEIERSKKGEDVIYVYEGPNGQTERNRWINLWVVGVAPPAEPRQVSREEIRISELAVAPEGDRVALIYRREDGRNQGNLAEVGLVTVADGSLRRVTQNRTPESELRWLPGGEALSVLAPDAEEWELARAKLYRVDLDGGRLELLSAAFEGDVDTYRWLPGGGAVDLVAAVRTVSGIYRLDLASGEVRPWLDGAGRSESVTFSSDGGRAGLVWSTPTSPPDVFLASFGTPVPERWSDLNPDLRAKASARVEVVRWKSTDDLEIEGLLVRPADGETGKLPFLLEIHGGPAGSFLQGWDGDRLLYVGRGYAVLCPNVRGSRGYGDELLRGNMRDLGGGDFQDLMTGVDAMIERGIADPDRLAVRGWSYGGILGGWTVTQTDRFQAASLGAMVSDWTSEYGQGFNFDVRRWYIGGDPWSDPERYRQMSPLTHVQRVTTPTILFHGEDDTTCTVEQSLNFFNALWEKGTATRMIRFPREEHGIREPRHVKVLWDEELAWIEKHVRRAEP